MVLESPNLIEEKIAASKRSLDSKMHQLFDNVESTSQRVVAVLGDMTGTLDSMSQTVHSIQRMANPEAIGGILRDAIGSFPLESNVRKQPWACVSGAAATGYIIGMLLTRHPGVSGESPSSQRSIEPSLFAQLRDRLIDQFCTTAEQTIKNIGDRAVEKLASILPNPDIISSTLGTERNTCVEPECEHS